MFNVAKPFKVVLNIEYFFRHDTGLFWAKVITSVPIDNEDSTSKFKSRMPLCGMPFNGSWGTVDWDAKTRFLVSNFYSDKNWEDLKKEISKFKIKTNTEARHIANRYYDNLYTPPDNETVEWNFTPDTPF